MQRLFEPRSVAVVGASTNPKKDGNIILRNIINSEFSGAIYPVNPNADEVCGLKAYPSLLDISDEVDLVVIIIPARFTPGIMQDCAAKGVKAVIIEAMGFSEVGDEGRKLQELIVDIAQKNGIRVMGPNCTGIVSRDLVTSFFPFDDVPDGNVSLIGQSGLLAAGMAADLISNRSLDVRKVCSIGNKCDVNENDLLEYLGKDSATSVIGVYLESFTDGREFVRIAKHITPIKPVVVLYGGRTAAGARSAKSHTGSIASDGKIVDTALKQSGCIKVDDFIDLRDYSKFFSTQPIPKGDRIAVVTAAGSVGVVISDLCEENNLRLADLSKDTVLEIMDVFPEWMIPKNPVDLWFSIEQHGLKTTLEKSMQALLKDPGVDGLIIVLAGFEYTLDVIRAKVVQEISSRYGKPVIVSVLVGYNEYKNLILEDLGRDIPVFTSLKSGVVVLSKACKYGINVYRHE